MSIRSVYEAVCEKHVPEKAPTFEEIQERGRAFCKEYEPKWPISNYQGACYHYYFHGGHCGVAFVNGQCCRCGVVDKEPKEEE